MSSSISSFVTTLSGGIQDISALLSLLGTEQCARHTGTVLLGGWIYAWATPISVFGSLGVAQTALSVFLATLSFKKFQGARHLRDSGYTCEGEVATMVTLQKQPEGYYYVADKRLQAMVDELHIDDPDTLTVSCQITCWNWLMAFSMVFVPPFALIPYINLFRVYAHQNPESGFPSWAWLIFRIMGTIICIISVQWALQIRIITILKRRLIFKSLLKVIGSNGAVSELVRQSTTQHPFGWERKLTAEECIWSLEKKISEMNSTDQEKGLEEPWSILKKTLLAEKKRQSLSPNNFLLAFCQLGLIIGSTSIIIGYIGTFIFVSTAARSGSKDALFWALLEAGVSLLRFGAWASNPPWDDYNTNLIFHFTLQATHVADTTGEYAEVLDEMRTIPLMGERDFFSRVTAFAGPVQRFEAKGLILYYTWAKDKQGQQVLYVTVHDPVTTYCFLYRHGSGSSNPTEASNPWKHASIRPDEDGLVSVITGSINTNDHPIMKSWPKLTQSLISHCQYIYESATVSPQKATDVQNIGDDGKVRKEKQIDIDVGWDLVL
jgi:hypothetical protein